MAKLVIICLTCVLCCAMLAGALVYTSTPWYVRGQSTGGCIHNVDAAGYWCPSK